MPLEQTDAIGEGYVHIYTGNGKGKTTAVLGLAFRAMGHGLKTYIGQFMKKYQYGELAAAGKAAPYITIEQYGTDQHVKRSPGNDDIESACNGMMKATEAMLSLKYEIVALDEILTANFFGIVPTDEILSIISSKPPGVELILTGRYAPREIIDMADLVTEMVEVTHYYQKGILARAGIEC